MSRVRQAGVLALSAIAAAEVRAQCPDGTPPPCASTRLAATRQRIDPPLNDNTWIVVPFTNVTRAPDVDWLRDASVNLLYLDLSRWRDIHVIDDARVADLVRQVPEARVSPISLEAATAIARRVGAGRLVMGSVIKQGSRTTLAAKVIDVRRNAVLRVPQEDLIVLDSLMPVFGRLARGILDLAPPPGTDIASIGTARIDAYQAYLAGTQALNRFELMPARTHFERALSLDSTFALAHYKLAIAIGWDHVTDTLTRRLHAATAARLSGSLPSRERTLIKGLDAYERRDYAVACETYGTLVKADSTDVDALYGVGECNYHDPYVLMTGSDTNQVRFRGSWNVAVRVFEKALAVDPNFHLAFAHILDAYSTTTRVGPLVGCRQQRTSFTCFYRAQALRDHDTLVTVPAPYTSDGFTAQEQEYLRTGARRTNLITARDKAKAWVADAPTENRAHVELAKLYTMLGDATGASQELAQLTGPLNDADAVIVNEQRLEIAVKRFDAVVARQLLDSARKHPEASLRPDVVALLFGNAAFHDSVFRDVMRNVTRTSQRIAQAWPPLVISYSLATGRAIIAGGIPTIAAIEKARFDSLSIQPPANASRTATIQTVLYALDAPRTWPVFSDPPADDHRAAAIVALARGDTNWLRRETLVLDSLDRVRPFAVPDSGGGLFVAQAYLAMRDSAAALRVVRRMLDTALVTAPLTTPIFGVIGHPVMLIWPRLALMRADLEAAAGNRVAAARWYRRFLDFWNDPDPEFAPIVARARAALAAVSAPR